MLPVPFGTSKKGVKARWRRSSPAPQDLGLRPSFVDPAGRSWRPRWSLLSPSLFIVNSLFLPVYVIIFILYQSVSKLYFQPIQKVFPGLCSHFLSFYKLLSLFLSVPRLILCLSVCSYCNRHKLYFIGFSLSHSSMCSSLTSHILYVSCCRSVCLSVSWSSPPLSISLVSMKIIFTSFYNNINSKKDNA